MLKINKNNNPSELGPWIPAEVTKSITQEKSTKQDSQIAKVDELKHRLTIRLPRIAHNLQHTSRSKKLALKVSYQSLELSQPSKDSHNTQGRYGALNGSVLHFYGQKDRSDKQDRRREKATIDSGGELSRRMSTLLIQPLDKQDLEKKVIEKNHCLLNAESSKKRSLCWLIKELKSSKELTQIYLSQRRNH